MTCEVKAKFTNNPLHPWSDIKTIQQPFFAGIKVGKSTFSILSPWTHRQEPNSLYYHGYSVAQPQEKSSN